MQSTETELLQRIEGRMAAFELALADLSVQMSVLAAATKKQKSKLEMPSKFMSFDAAAVALAISASSIRKRKCGTEDLHHVRQGDRVLLLRSEVESLAARRISEALTPRERAARKLNAVGGRRL